MDDLWLQFLPDRYTLKPVTCFSSFQACAQKKIVDDGPEAVNLHYMVVRVFTKMEHNERSLVMKDPPYEL